MDEVMEDWGYRKQEMLVKVSRLPDAHPLKAFVLEGIRLVEEVYGEIDEHGRVDEELLNEMDDIIDGVRNLKRRK